MQYDTRIFLKEYVEKQIWAKESRIPESDHEKIIAIRNWAFRTIPIDDDCWDRNNFFLDDFNKMLLKGKGGYCQGCSWVMEMLLGSVGIKAGSFSFGGEPPVSHVVTLAKITVHGARLLVPYDSYWGLEFTDPGGKPMDFWLMQKAIKKGSFDEFVCRPAQYRCTKIDIRGNKNVSKKGNGECRCLMIDFEPFQRKNAEAFFDRVRNTFGEDINPWSLLGCYQWFASLSPELSQEVDRYFNG